MECIRHARRGNGYAAGGTRLLAIASALVLPSTLMSISATPSAFMMAPSSRPFCRCAEQVSRREIAPLVTLAKPCLEECAYGICLKMLVHQSCTVAQEFDATYSSPRTYHLIPIRRPLPYNNSSSCSSVQRRSSLLGSSTNLDRMSCQVGDYFGGKGYVPFSWCRVSWAL